MTLIVGAVLLIQGAGKAQRATTLYLQPGSIPELRTWDAYVTQRERSGELYMTSVERDPAFPSRTLERLQQFHNGISVWGSNVIRDTDTGVVASLHGALAPNIDIATIPTLRLADVQARLANNAGTSVVREPSLVVLPMESGDYRLAYTAVISSESVVERVFVDAYDGSELLRYSEIQTQAAVGSGKAVLGDTKKVTAVREGGVFWADGQLRPPLLRTFDMRGNLSRALNVWGGAPLSALIAPSTLTMSVEAVLQSMRMHISAGRTITTSNVLLAVVLTIAIAPSSLSSTASLNKAAQVTTAHRLSITYTTRFGAGCAAPRAWD